MGVERTTVMLRNLPSLFTRGMLVDLLNSLGFVGKYDFVHLPVDMSRLSCLGFGFVNFRSHADALQFFKDAHGFQNWQHQSNKVLDISWSNPLRLGCASAEVSECECHAPERARSVPANAFWKRR